MPGCSPLHGAMQPAGRGQRLRQTHWSARLPMDWEQRAWLRSMSCGWGRGELKGVKGEVKGVRGRIPFAGKRWSFFPVSDLGPLTGAVLLVPFRHTVCCWHLCSAHFPLTRADLSGALTLALSLSSLASPVLCSDTKHWALAVKAQNEPELPAVP